MGAKKRGPFGCLVRLLVGLAAVCGVLSFVILSRPGGSSGAATMVSVIDARATGTAQAGGVVTARPSATLRSEGTMVSVNDSRATRTAEAGGGMRPSATVGRTESPAQQASATASAGFEAVIAEVEGVRLVNLAAIVGGDIVALELCVDAGLVTEEYAQTLRDVAADYVGSTPLVEFSAILDEGVQAISFLWRPDEGWSRVVLTSIGTACG